MEKTQINNYNYLRKQEIFINILFSSNKTCYKILRYLTPEDIHNLMLVNKKICQALKNSQNYIYDKYMLNYYGENYLFIYQRKMELKKLPEIIQITKESDKYYKSFYKIANILVNIYYFSGCFLLLDVLILLIILYNLFPKIKIFFIHLPLIVQWLLSLIVLVFNFILEKKVEMKLNEYVNEKIPEIDEITKKRLLKGISKRLCNQQPISYKPLAFIFLLCYIPFLCKLYLEKMDHKTTFFTVALLLAFIFFVLDFVRIFIYKYKNTFEIKDEYKYIYFDGESEYYQTKVNNEIAKVEKPSSLGEGLMCFLYLFFKVLIFGLIIYYAYLIGKKLDEPKYDVSWELLFIPVDFIGVFIFIWGLLYIFSTKDYKIKGKIILYITILIIIICAAVNIIAFPNYISKQGITPYFPFIINVIITLAILTHFITLKIIKKNNKYELD